MPCTRHRVFLATMIVAAKYLNDSSPKNKHWASFAKIFDPAEINLMEKQLLFLLDYDLRFDEAEAIAHFAPFMNRRNEAAKEARAAAVTRVKARVQAHISMPPTPPHDVVEHPARPSPSPAAPAATSSVQTLVKRLSTTYLTISSGNGASRGPRPLSRASSSSTLGTASASGDSESGSLTSSSSCSSPATSVSSFSETEDVKESHSDRPFVLGPVPVHAMRQGRKVSTASTCTIKGESGSLSPSNSSKRVTLDVELGRAIGLGRGSTKRSSLSQSHSSGSFLSRMFGSGKPQAQEESIEPQDGQRSLRRLTSKTMLFRGQATGA